MKLHLECERGKLCGFLLALLFAFSNCSAQDFHQQRQEQLSKLDLSGISNTMFLNAGISNQNESDYFKKRWKTNSSSPEKVLSEEWKNLFERLEGADLRDANSKIPAIENLTETDPEKLTKSNVIPIGIMNFESIYMSVNELVDNEKNKKNGQKIDFSAYEKFNIVYASVLQEDVYQSAVKFRFTPDLYMTNQSERLDRIELDFHDGKGYKPYSVADEPMSYEFQSIGEHQISIRFKASQRAWIFETKVNVRQLERVKPYKEFQVSAQRISSDTANSDRSARTALVGGNVRIILGCDQIFNKPIIIAEGFDMGQDVTLDKIEARYRAPLDKYLSEGYDLVLLDYADARTAMENNAQVLKALIQQVNQMKTGNAQLVVIGESMSGLVARWALRQMENEGIAHQVKLMICYDTPHQGANVPVGLTQLLWDAKPSLLSQVILKFFAKGWRNYYQALATPAGTQLLLHWGGQITGGVGSKAPAFDAFRTQLLALGNGGYPQSCRNIAIIHGSINAGDRAIFNNYNYGSRILRSWTPFGLQNTNIDVHTNQLNQDENVFSFGAWGIFAKAVGVNRKYNSPLNDDFLPGGRSINPIPNKLFFETSSFDFCFVPTFSSTDYQGARDTQAERELLNVQAVVAPQTPFAAVYGGENPNDNTIHVSTRSVDWPAIGQSEGLRTDIPACPALPTPPTPNISNFTVCYPFSEKRTTEDNTANVTVSLVAPSNGLYVHNWTVLPSQQSFTTTGDQITFQAEHPGSYQVICVRTYPNRRDLQSTFTTTMLVQDCATDTAVPGDPDPDNDPNPPVADGDIAVSDIWEGDFLLTTAADSVAVFAHYTPAPKVLYATLQNGTFVPRATLEESGMFEEFAALFAETDPRIALPVTIQSFNVVAEGTQATVTWTTLSEINSSYFEIERSATGKDWEKIGTVSAKNTDNEKVDYTFTDPGAISGVRYYRLKMVDADDTFAYSRMQILRSGSGSEIAAYPNPVNANDALQLLSGDQQVNGIKIYNSSGKLIFESDKSEIKFNVKDLPVGLYIVKIRLKDGSEASKTFVKR